MKYQFLGNSKDSIATDNNNNNNNNNNNDNNSNYNNIYNYTCNKVAKAVKQCSIHFLSVEL